MMNTTGNFTSGKSSKAKTAFLATVLCLVLLVELIGNLLVLAVLRKQRRNIRQRVTNALLANLAFIDLLVPTFLVPFALAVLVHGIEILSYAVCQVNGFFNNLVGSASILTMAVIAIDRYLAIVSPLGGRLHFRHALFLLCSVWGISIVISLLPILFWGSYKATDKSQTCKPGSASFILLLSITCFAIPFLIMVYCYTKVFIKVRRHKKLLSTLKSGDRNTKTEFQTTKIVFVVLSAFIIAWLPFVLIYLLSSNNEDIHISPMIFQVFGIVAAAHPMCNPIIYLVLNRSFRRDAFGLIPCLGRFVNTQIESDSQSQRSTMRNKSNNKSKNDSSTANMRKQSENIEVVALD